MTDVVCISGQSWIGKGFWEAHYAKEVTAYFKQGASFLLGAQRGVDQEAQLLLSRLCEEAGPDAYARVSIVLPTSSEITPEELENARVDSRFNLLRQGTGYKSRDEWMVKNATKSVIHLSPVEGGVSGCIIGVLLNAGFTIEQAKVAFDAIRKAHVPEDKHFSAALHALSERYNGFNVNSDGTAVAQQLTK